MTDKSSYNPKTIKNLLPFFKDLKFSDSDRHSIETRKVDKVWIYLFYKYDIKSQIDMNGFYKISATQIKEVYEPRLAVKFDHRKNLPIIFIKYGLSILPDSRGTYLIIKFDAYKDFNINKEFKKNKPIYFRVPEYIQSLDINSINSEAIALNVAYVTGILADFLEDEELLPTVSGRMSSDNFSFKIIINNSSTEEIEINNSQIEIDAAFEGINYLSIIEAKLNISDDFLIRQLYYPFRTWSKRVLKIIKPVFLIYSNNIFRLYEYKFVEPDNYNSLELVKYKQYTLEEKRITLDKIQELLDETSIIGEPKYNEIPFIQANDFNKVVNLCELLFIKGSITQEDLANVYDFNVRQSEYYSNAGKYLGLIAKKNKIYTLTPLGKKLFSLDYYDKQVMLIKKMIEHSPINQVLRGHLNKGEKLTQNEAFTILKRIPFLADYYGERTIFRRSGSIASWAEWIVNLIDD